MNLDPVALTQTQPVIQTERLTLSPFVTSDLPDILAYASNEAVAKTVPWPAHQSLKDSEAFLEWIAKSISFTPGKLFYVWAIRKKSDGRAIGSIDFKQPYPHSGQIDYVISQEQWNQGLVTEAAQAVIQWSFKTIPELVRMQSFCIADNIGSRRVMEKCGLELEGLRKKSMTIKGKIFDIAYYALVK